MPDRERGREGRAAGARTGVPTPRDPALVRNVVLVGHAGAGKTTLVETLLAETATIGRAGRVEDGTTVADADPVEARLGHSVALSLAPFEYGGVKVNLLDTPGHPDFVGDLRAGLRAADAALFVVSAVDGVDAQTVALWEECDHVGMPRAVVVTRLDSPRADFEQVVAVLQREFGAGVLPLHLPMHADDESVAGLIQLLSQRVADYSVGQRTERDPDPEHVPLIDQARSALIEAVIAESEDETLLDRYLAGEPVPFEVLVDDLETAVARAAFHPVLAVARLAEGEGWVGTAELLEVLTSAFPGPSERAVPVVTSPAGRPEGPLSCDPTGPLVAEVLKTTSDPYAGRLSLVRVFSGTLRPDQPVHLSGHGLDTSRGLGLGLDDSLDVGDSQLVAYPDYEQHDVDERVGQLSTPLGAQFRPVAECRAGDLCTIARLTRAETGDTLSAPAHPLVMAPWERDEPLLPLAVEATGAADDDRLATGLARLIAEDPTLRLERAETGQTVLWCMGQTHADVALDRLRTRAGVAVETVPLRLPLKETLAGPVEAVGRHVKQSGGHGQYAVCRLRVEPLPAGAGLEFLDATVGGSVPRQYVPSVEKGVRMQAGRGLLGPHEVVDLRITLLDGKAHSVDSSDAAFQTAGALALREAGRAGGVRLLEPVLELEVIVPDERVGPVLSDLSARRGRVTGTAAAPDGLGRSVVRAEVPEAEVVRYALELRALTHGTGRFRRRHLRHQPVPEALAGSLLEPAGH